MVPCRLQLLVLDLSRDDNFCLIFQHFVCELKTLYAFELGVDLLSFHSRRVPENSVEHLIFRSLEPVLVSNLALDQCLCVWVCSNF
jgi:hypothetical protein